MKLEERAALKVAAAYDITLDGSQDERFLDFVLAGTHAWHNQEAIVNYFAVMLAPSKRTKLMHRLAAIDAAYNAEPEDADRLVFADDR